MISSIIDPDLQLAKHLDFLNKLKWMLEEDQNNRKKHLISD